MICLYSGKAGCEGAWQLVLAFLQNEPISCWSLLLNRLMHLLCAHSNTYIKIVTIFHFRQKKIPRKLWHAVYFGRYSPILMFALLESADKYPQEKQSVSKHLIVMLSQCDKKSECV